MTQRTWRSQKTQMIQMTKKYLLDTFMAFELKGMKVKMMKNRL